MAVLIPKASFSFESKLNPFDFSESLKEYIDKPKLMRLSDPESAGKFFVGTATPKKINLLRIKSDWKIRLRDRQPEINGTIKETKHGCIIDIEIEIGLLNIFLFYILCLFCAVLTVYSIHLSISTRIFSWLWCSFIFGFWVIYTWHDIRSKTMESKKILERVFSEIENKYFHF